MGGFTLVQDHVAAQEARPVIEEYQEDPNDQELFDERMRSSANVADPGRLTDAGGLVKKKSKFSKMKSALGLKKKDKGRTGSNSGTVYGTVEGLGLSSSFHEEPDYNRDRE